MKALDEFFRNNLLGMFLFAVAAGIVSTITYQLAISRHLRLTEKSPAKKQEGTGVSPKRTKTRWSISLIPLAGGLLAIGLFILAMIYLSKSNVDWAERTKASNVSHPDEDQSRETVEPAPSTLPLEQVEPMINKRDHTQNVEEVSLSTDEVSVPKYEYDTLSMGIEWGNKELDGIRPDAHINFVSYFPKYRYSETPGRVNTVALSPDESIALSGSQQGHLDIWSMSDGRHLGRLEGHSKRVSSVEFSPSGKLAASASGDASVIVWDVQAQRVAFRLNGHSKAVTSLSFFPDQEHLLLTGSDDKTVRSWDLSKSDKAQSVVAYSSPLLSVAISPSGSQALLGMRSGKLAIIEVDSGAILSSSDQHKEEVASVAWCENGTTALSGSRDGSLIFWDTEHLQPKWSAKGHVGFAKSVDPVHSVALSVDCSIAVTGGGDQTVRIWDVATGEEIGRKGMGLNNAVFSVAIAQDSTRVVSGGQLGLKMFNLQSGKDLIAPNRGPIESLGAVPNSLDLVAVRNERLELWNLSSGTKQGSFKGDVESASRVAVPPQGSVVISVHDKTSRRSGIKAWGIPSRRTLWNYSFDGKLDCLSFSPSGRLVAVGGWGWISRADAHAAIVDLSSGEELYRIPTRAHLAAFSSENEILLASSNKMELWDLQNTKVLRVFHGSFTEPYQRFNPISVSSDGELVATANSDHKIEIWEIDSGNRLQTLEGHTKWVIDILFAPNSNVLYSIGLDKKLKGWDIINGTVLSLQDFSSASDVPTSMTLVGANLVIGTERGVIYHFNTQI